ncbi:hypothetical protein [Vibrio parahaemolyticus]|uniref:hypothetical protein n=1 Tax=Vibrio parahaemolyticus TaxID=670 RepID=UPI001F2539A5|nr:hypothetical protein [Vibrio parahaemolyticus]
MEWLKELRKLNCLVLLATQALNEAIKSGILDVLMESCPTQVSYPTPRRGSLPKPITSLVSMTNNRPAQKRRAQTRLLRPPTHGERLVDLSLDKLALAFVGASDKESVNTIRQLVSEHGEKLVSALSEQQHILEDDE